MTDPTTMLCCCNVYASPAMENKRKEEKEMMVKLFNFLYFKDVLMQHAVGSLSAVGSL